MRQPLTLRGPSPLHSLHPHTKVASLLLFVLAVVSTPREAAWAHAACGAMVVALAVLAGLRLRTLVARLVLELPFLLFAALLPFVARGERVEILGLVHVSSDGLWGAWGIVAKATLGLAAALVVVAATPVTDLLHGLQRLHVPVALTTIAALMLRYLELVRGELQRMQVARLSRGDDPRWLGQARALAATIGALFVRTFERGERVHQAMLARGWDGHMPTSAAAVAPVSEWLMVLAVPGAAALLSVLAWTVR